MSLPPFLISHGEKVALAAVLLLAVYGVLSTYSDDSTRAERTVAQIDGEFAQIDSAVQSARTVSGRPNLRDAANIPEHIRRRFALTEGLSIQPPIAFVHEIWSLGETSNLSYPPFLYGFEIHAPSLQTKDQVGFITLELTLPEARRSAQHQRLRDGLSRMEITRRVGPRESYVNTAEVLGIQIERRREGGAWEPLPQLENPVGFVPLRQQQQQQRGRQVHAENFRFEVRDVSEWQTYSFRARLLAAATGPQEPGRPTLGNEVLVFAGSSPLSPEGDDWRQQDTLAFQGVPLNIPTAERMHTNARSRLQPLLARPLDAREQIYLGPWSEVAREQVSSSTRFALIRVSPPMQEGAAPRIQLGLTRQQDGRWIPLQRMEPDAQRDNAVGGRVVVRNPETGLNEEVDLSTPFRVVDVTTTAERITHYEIRNTSNPETGGRMLDVTPRIDRMARTVTLENIHSGSRMTLVQLGRLVLRPASDTWVNYPDYPPGSRNEIEIFEEDPMSFRQPSLSLPEPIEHAPDSPRLWELFPDAPRTEAPYLELPDGRFLVIDALNPRMIRTFVRPGSRYDRERSQDGDGDEGEDDQG